MSGAESGERLLQTFLELVRIDSPSGEEAACAEYVAQQLGDVGCSIRFDASAATTGSNIGNLIAELPGTAPGVLVLSAHFDTVEPGRGIEPVVLEGLVVSKGETVLGADDKAGVAAAIECVRRLVESGEPRPTVRCIFTVQEERGLLGAKALDPADVYGDLCLVLDADGLPGGIVTAAPTHYTFVATYVGRAAHAGVAPEKGVSAIAIASDAISRLPMGRLDDETTANVGTIEGGSATNVVAARVRTTGECRSLDRDRVESVRREMDEIMRKTAEEHGGEVEIAWTREYEGFSLPEADPSVETIKQACYDLGLEPHTMRTGGGSDANILSALGLPTVALASGMQGVHSTSEQIAVADLEALARICVATAKRLAESRA